MRPPPFRVCIVKQPVSLSLSLSPPANTFRNKPRDERLQAREFIKGDYALILHRDSFPPCRRRGEGVRVHDALRWKQRNG